MADALATNLDEVFSSEPVEPTPEPIPESAPEPQPEPELVPEPEPQPEPAKEEHSVPLAKYLDTRDEAKELKRRIAELEARQAPKQQDVPDPVDDPQGFAAYQNEGFQKALVAQKFEISDVMAKREHGAEAVQAAADWAMERAANDPSFRLAYMREPHPIDWIVRQHKRDGLVSQLPDDVSSLDELIEREIARRGLAAQPAPETVATQQQAPKPAAPRPSLVNAPSGGGVEHTPTGATAGLAAIFPR